MITNFEEITEPLTHDEKMIILKLNNLLEFRTKKNPVKAPDLVMLVKRETFLNKQFSQVRLRKLVNFIRTNSLMPIMATSKGYYLAHEDDELKSEIKSLEERAMAILAAARGLKKLLKHKEQLEIF